MKIMFVSLGCDKNLVDTENMMGILQRSSYEFTDDESEADVFEASALPVREGRSEGVAS